jgi:hypothetical protein
LMWETQRLCFKEKVCLSIFGWYLRQRVSAQMVYDFLLQHNTPFSFVPDPLDLLLTDWPVIGRSAEQSSWRSPHVIQSYLI